MKVECPKCSYVGNVPDKLIPDQGRDIKCPKCQVHFWVNKEPGPAVIQNEPVREPEPIVIQNAPVKEHRYDGKYIYHVRYLKQSFFFSYHNTTKIQNLINQLAAEGWELDKVTVAVAGGFIFKREAMILFFKKEVPS